MMVGGRRRLPILATILAPGSEGKKSVRLTVTTHLLQHKVNNNMRNNPFIMKGNGNVLTILFNLILYHNVYFIYKDLTLNIHLKSFLNKITKFIH